MKFSTIFADSTSHLLKWALYLFLSGCAIVVFDSYFDFNSLGSAGRVVKEVAGNIGLSLLVATFVILVVDVALRKQTISDIEELLLQHRRALGVRDFSLQRKSFDQQITDDVRAAPKSSRIDLIGITQKSFFTDAPGNHVLAEKVMGGCDVRVLVLHPKSPILPCYQNLSKDFGSPDLSLSLQAAAQGSIKQTYKGISAVAKQARGTFEVRMFNEAYSTLFYYGGYQLSVMGTYLSHKRGTLSPAFVVEDSRLQQALEQHFNCLWELSTNNVLFKVNKAEILDNSSQHFGNSNLSS
ncbi:hypothetical protein [Desulfobotulus mexicanus]|uniref:Uncharacterized protein n=1 Tax=Desulfobotulus mexicanus TaxID=2586642 RepID=A0A5S5MFB1_9BACT|nr:hypothetical protein [Desulfobotulus mexicanus]TYT74369.1 hypothetical protein FIM25_10430 [Desulfobotulus mexicanus]